MLEEAVTKRGFGTGLIEEPLPPSSARGTKAFFLGAQGLVLLVFLGAEALHHHTNPSCRVALKLLIFLVTQHSPHSLKKTVTHCTVYISVKVNVREGVYDVLTGNHKS